MRQGWVGHLDADCFYVSAERRRRAVLGRLPLGVLGNQGACVIAKSYEMKAAGVKTGEPIWQAIEKCPDGAYLKRDFRWYEVLSRCMLAVARELSPRVEYYSIDEFFFEVPRGVDAQRFAEAARDRILETVGVPVTVGVARTRTLAKLVSDTAKPFGALAVLDRGAEESYLQGRPVTEITGIAGRRERRLQPWNIRTCLDLARADRRLVRELLTATGESLWWELQGESVLPLHPDRPLHKVLSRGGSFGEGTSDPVVLWAWAVRHLERLVDELECHEVLAGRVTVWVVYRDGQAGEGRSRLESPSDRFDVLLEAVRAGVRRAWRPRATAQRMHLFADLLSPRRTWQRGLFEPPVGRAEAVAELKRYVNRRHGRFALRSAATLPLAAIYRDRANSYDICDVRGKMCF